MITKRKVKKFIDKFADYLHSGIVATDFELDTEENAGERIVLNTRVMTYDEVFQIFGRHVEKELGIKFFDKEKKNRNENI